MNIAAQRKPGKAAARPGFFPRSSRLRPVVLAGALTVSAACVLAGCSAAGTAASGSQQVALSAQSSTTGTASLTATTAAGYQALTLNDDRDVTFNQLLGINNAGKIVGYFGSGDAGHPNKGYALERAVLAGQLRQREFPRRSADADYRPQRRRRQRRLLLSDQRQQCGRQQQLRLLAGGRAVSRGQFPDQEQRQAAGQPAARRQRHGHRGRFLQRQRGQRPRLRVQHRVRTVQGDHGEGRDLRDRHRHQQRGDRGRLLHRRGRHRRLLPADAPRAHLHDRGPRRGDDTGIRCQRQGRSRRRLHRRHGCERCHARLHLAQREVHDGRLSRRPAAPPSTASTTRATSSASTPTPRATPTGLSDCRSRTGAG